MEVHVGGKFRLGPKIGSGSFGDVHLGSNVHTGEEVAIKIEPIKSRYPRLLFESKVYKMLAGSVGIPRVHWYGVAGDYQVMVIDLLGPSLQDLFECSNCWFSLKTVLILANQIIDRVEHLHTKSYIHRDIKPENLLIGRGKNNLQVHLIDFGLAMKYWDNHKCQHIRYRENLNLTGTASYVSINTHFGIQQSRRDDLETLGYVLMYFSRGSLPWQGPEGNSQRERLKTIKQIKLSTPIEALCENLPCEFMTHMHYCRSLRFEDKPDYAYIRRLFKNMLFLESHWYDFAFEWRLYSEVQSDEKWAFDQQTKCAD